MKLIKTLPNGTKVYEDDVCPRCGGAGQADKWKHTGLICFECGGSGKRRQPKIIRVTVAKAEKDALKVEYNNLVGESCALWTEYTYNYPPEARARADEISKRCAEIRAIWEQEKEAKKNRKK